MDKNSALAETYRKYWPTLNRTISENSHIKFSNPLLLHVFPEYEQAPIKLFVVGQQTGGWDQPIAGDPVDCLMKCYEKFQLGEKHKRVPFWRANHLLYKKLNPGSPKLGFVWSNLVKVDQNKDRISPEVEEKVCSAFPVLPLEIQITKPGVVVFFTGPRFDARLKKTFEGAEFESLDDCKKRVIARVKHEDLPYNTFRTYHPSYIVQSLNLNQIVDTIIQHIKI